MQFFSLFLISTVCISSALYAQSVKWGVELGLGHSSLGFPKESLFLGRETERYLLSTLVFAEIDASEVFAIQLGVSYSQYGNNQDVQIIGNNPHGRFLQRNLHYLAIPLRIRYFPFRNNVYLIAGPQLGYVASLKLDYFMGLTPSLRFEETINRFNAGLTTGVGFRKELEQQILTIQLMYDRATIWSIGDWHTPWDTQSIYIQTGLLFKR